MEQTTPTGHLLFDTSALARNLDFLDIDVDRHLGRTFWGRENLMVETLQSGGGFVTFFFENELP